jgi:hypothetical protein
LRHDEEREGAEAPIDLRAIREVGGGEEPDALTLGVGSDGGVVDGRDALEEDFESTNAA